MWGIWFYGAFAHIFFGHGGMYRILSVVILGFAELLCMSWELDGGIAFVCDRWVYWLFF